MAAMAWVVVAPCRDLKAFGVAKGMQAEETYIHGGRWTSLSLGHDLDPLYLVAHCDDCLHSTILMTIWKGILEKWSSGRGCSNSSSCDADLIHQTTQRWNIDFGSLPICQ